MKLNSETNSLNTSAKGTRSLAKEPGKAAEKIEFSKLESELPSLSKSPDFSNSRNFAIKPNYNQKSLVESVESSIDIQNATSRPTPLQGPTPMNAYDHVPKSE